MEQNRKNLIAAVAVGGGIATPQMWNVQEVGHVEREDGELSSALSKFTLPVTWSRHDH